MVKKSIVTCLLLTTLLFPGGVCALELGGSEIKEVVSVSPEWPTFTNRDGTGLYHEVLRAVFDLYDLPVRHQFVPSDRGDELVRQGAADMMTCDDFAVAPLSLARYPMFVSDFYVFFKKDRIGPWKGPESLRGKEIVCQKGYYHDWNFPVPVRIRTSSSGEQALKMILFGRSDFYVDDMTFIEQSINDAETPFDRDEYDMRKAGTRSYHPQMNNSDRGRAIRKMYEDGIIRLHREGELKAIYEKWGHSYPDFESF